MLTISVSFDGKLQLYVKFKLRAVFAWRIRVTEENR